MATRVPCREGWRGSGGTARVGSVSLRPTNLEPWAPHATGPPTEVAGVAPLGRQGGRMGTSTSGLVLLHPLCPRCIWGASLLRPRRGSHSSRHPAMPRQVGQSPPEPAKPISLHGLRDKPKNNLVIFHSIHINISAGYKQLSVCLGGSMLGEGLSVGVGCRGQGLSGVTVPRGGLAPLQGGLCTRLQSGCFAPAVLGRAVPPR